MSLMSLSASGFTQASNSIVSEEKVRRLEKMVVTFSQAKQSLKESLEKQEGLSDTSAEPEMAVEVLDRGDAARQPLEQALIVERIFRKAIEESIAAG